MSIIKKRLSPEESRSAALSAARELLIEAGPQAVTLKAVAGRIGRTHANLLHHFGSAAGLQKALTEYLSHKICVSIAEKVIISSDNQVENLREIVDLAFDAFDKEGAGALTSWMLLSGNEDALDPIVEAIHETVHDLAQLGHKEDDKSLHENTLYLCLMALGDALMGEQLASALGLPRQAARDIAERNLLRNMEEKQTI